MSELVALIAEMEARLNRAKQHFSELPTTQLLISRLLISLGRELSGRMDQKLRPHGLSEVEFRILVLLHSFPGETVTPRDLCSGDRQSPANITRITDALVERGLISRLPDTSDRRRLLLQVTPQGTALIATTISLMSSSTLESYRDFSPEELQTLTISLKRLAATLDGLAEPAANGAPAKP